MARRNLAGKPCQQGPSNLCGSHICLHVSLPTALVLPPGRCTSISPHSVFFCTRRCQRIGTEQTGGLLSLPLPGVDSIKLLVYRLGFQKTTRFYFFSKNYQKCGRLFQKTQITECLNCKLFFDSCGPPVRSMWHKN